MSDVVNLNRFKKRQTRRAKEKRAAENRALHGQTKAQKARARAEEERRARTLDGASREGVCEDQPDASDVGQSRREDD